MFTSLDNLNNNSDETSLVNMWKDFSDKNKVTLYVCVSAAFRRGILGDNKSQLKDNGVVVNDVFHVCGLSTIIENVLFCDRFVQF